jgi:hypothetical protein
MNTLRLRRRASLALLLMSACTHPPERQVMEWPQASDREQTASLARPSDRILSSELRAIDANTAAEAIRRLRPEFLQAAPSQQIGVRATSPAVYVDNRLAGGLETLAGIPLGLVSEIRRFSPLTAKTTFGSYCECQGGVIVVTTISRSP